MDLSTLYTIVEEMLTAATEGNQAEVIRLNSEIFVPVYDILFGEESPPLARLYDTARNSCIYATSPESFGPNIREEAMALAITHAREYFRQIPRP
jgi:hypothetical protein